MPDLESIAKEYLNNLRKATNDEPGAEYDYNWILLEMYDQTVRNSSGGEMAKYLFQKEIPNKEYVFNRIGEEGKKIHYEYLNSVGMGSNLLEESDKESFIAIFNRVNRKIKSTLIHLLLSKEYDYFKQSSEALKIGQFRMSGEVHQHMYDRYSLKKMLTDNGFKNPKIISAFESNIKNWDKYHLDSVGGRIRKPDSLFVEAIK